MDQMPNPQTPPAAPQQPAPQPAAQPQSAPVQPAVPLSEADKKDIEQNKGIAVLSYISLLFLVPLLMAKQSKFAQFHAKQGLVLFVAEIALSIVGGILHLGGLAGLLGLIVSIYCILQAWEGKYWEIPYVGQYAKKINL